MNKHAPHPDNRLTVETNMNWEVRVRKEKRNFTEMKMLTGN